MPTRILIAADKFKGALTAQEACAAIERGLARVVEEGALDREIETRCHPVADGGEGTAKTICAALGGEWIRAEVLDPLGRTVEAGYGLAGELAVIEMSQASGLWRLEAGERDPRRASTFGTGQLMRDAVARGARDLIIGIGGSATNDGGTGMAEALGYRFYGVGNELLSGMPAGLEGLERIEDPSEESGPMEVVRVRVACDVRNPLLGPAGATRIYGPQKGVGEEEFSFFEDRLARLAEVAARDLGRDPREELGSGAAGGLGFGLMAFCGARLEPGFELVAGATGLAESIAWADRVITGEGQIDAQTAQGKAPGGVAALAAEADLPVLAVGGHVSAEGEDREIVAQTFDLTLSLSEVYPGLSVSERMARNAELLEESIVRTPELVKMFVAGRSGV